MISFFRSITNQTGQGTRYPCGAGMTGGAKPYVYGTERLWKIRIGFILGSFFAKLNVFNSLQEFGAISFFALCARLSR
jgi:hypothetical protein